LRIFIITAYALAITPLFHLNHFSAGHPASLGRPTFAGTHDDGRSTPEAAIARARDSV